jgi:hypothetical protein
MYMLQYGSDGHIHLPIQVMNVLPGFYRLSNGKQLEHLLLKIVLLLLNNELNIMLT